MEHIEVALAAQNQYLRHYGCPSEEDHSLNDTNRALIEAMKIGRASCRERVSKSV